MQDILAELFWRSEVIDEQADRLRQTLPGFSEVQQDYDALAEQIRGMAGPELYDRYFAQLMRYSSYEVCAYYSQGLGLREEVVRALFTPRSSSPSPAWS